MTIRTGEYKYVLGVFTSWTPILNRKGKSLPIHFSPLSCKDETPAWPLHHLHCGPWARMGLLCLGLASAPWGWAPLVRLFPFLMISDSLSSTTPTKWDAPFGIPAISM